MSSSVEGNSGAGEDETKSIAEVSSVMLSARVVPLRWMRSATWFAVERNACKGKVLFLWDGGVESWIGGCHAPYCVVE